MGLDSVELVIEFEEAFQTAIPDDLAGRMETPGDVLDFLVATRCEPSREGCLTRTAYYRLRAGIAAYGSVERSSLTPRTRVDRVLGGASGVNRLARTVGFREPRIRSRDLSTLGQLAREVAASNYGLLAKQKGEWREDELWESLRRVIARQLGLPVGRIFRESSFVGDLGVD